MHGNGICQLRGEAHQLRFTIGSSFAIDAAIPDGADAAARRLYDGDFMIEELREVAAHLLVGGGATYAEAHRLLDGLPIRETPALAYAALKCFADSPSDEENEPMRPSAEKKASLGDVYAVGFQLGLKPQEVRDMTVWEWGRCVEGWSRAQGADDEVRAPEKTDIDDLVAKYG